MSIVIYKSKINAIKTMIQCLIWGGRGAVKEVAWVLIGSVKEI